MVYQSQVILTPGKFYLTRSSSDLTWVSRISHDGDIDVSYIGYDPEKYIAEMLAQMSGIDKGEYEVRKIGGVYSVSKSRKHTVLIGKDSIEHMGGNFYTAMHGGAVDVIVGEDPEGVDDSEHPEDTYGILCSERVVHGIGKDKFGNAHRLGIATQYFPSGMKMADFTASDGYRGGMIEMVAELPGDATDENPYRCHMLVGFMDGDPHLLGHMEGRSLIWKEIASRKEDLGRIAIPEKRLMLGSLHEGDILCVVKEDGTPGELDGAMFLGAVPG